MALTGADMMRQALAAGRYDNVMNNAAFSTQQTNKAAAESGQAMGVTMHVVSNPLADLQNSMEELSFQFEEKEMKKIGERKFGDKHGPNAAYLTAVQKWQKVMPDMPGGPFMERMLRQLRAKQAQRQPLDGESLLGMLGEGSKDPSHQFAMLEILEQSLGKGDMEIARAVKSARKILEETRGPEMRAGLNLAEQINAQAGDADEIRELRDLYRGEVLGYTTPQECFRSLLAKEGPGKLSASIDFLVSGCSVDLQSPSPSQSPEELRRIILDLQSVSVLATVLEKSDLLMRKMDSEFGIKCTLTGEQFMGRLLDLTERSFVDAQDVKDLIADCGVKKPLAKVYFCMELMNSVRSLSSRLFADEADRIRLVEVGQQHLDDLVLAQEKEDVLEGRRAVE